MSFLIEQHFFSIWSCVLKYARQRICSTNLLVFFDTFAGSTFSKLSIERYNWITSDICWQANYLTKPTQALAKRLIYGKSALENEKCAISQLKREFGILFTSKIEAMCKDIELSKDLNDRFIQVLTSTLKFDTFQLIVAIVISLRQTKNNWEVL